MEAEGVGGGLVHGEVLELLGAVRTAASLDLEHRAWIGPLPGLESDQG